MVRHIHVHASQAGFWPVCLGVDYTHIASRLMRLTMQDRINNVLLLAGTGVRFDSNKGAYERTLKADKMT